MLFGGCVVPAELQLLGGGVYPPVEAAGWEGCSRRSRPCREYTLMGGLPQRRNVRCCAVFQTSTPRGIYSPAGVRTGAPTRLQGHVPAHLGGTYSPARARTGAPRGTYSPARARTGAPRGTYSPAGARAGGSLGHFARESESTGSGPSVLLPCVGGSFCPVPGLLRGAADPLALVGLFAGKFLLERAYVRLPPREIRRAQCHQPGGPRGLDLLDFVLHGDRRRGPGYPIPGRSVRGQSGRLWSASRSPGATSRVR